MEGPLPHLRRARAIAAGFGRLEAVCLYSSNPRKRESRGAALLSLPQVRLRRDDENSIVLPLQNLLRSDNFPGMDDLAQVKTKVDCASRMLWRALAYKIGRQDPTHQSLRPKFRGWTTY